MNQSYFGRWIVRLYGYHMIIEHRMRDKHQNADSLSKKNEFYERLEQKQANQAEIKEGFSFLNKNTYEVLPLTRCLDKIWTSNSGTPRVTGGKGSRNKDLIKKGTGAFGSVATFEPGPGGTLSYEQKQPLIVG